MDQSANILSLFNEAKWSAKANFADDIVGHKPIET
jgi:hypothetical protein